MICGLCDQEIVGNPYEWKIFEWSDEIRQVCLECYLEIEEYESIGDVASGFWEEYNRTHNNLPHICDYSIDNLKKKHANVLSLCQEYDPWLIGLLIAGELYEDVWASRSCSGHLASLIEIYDNDIDYMDYYCNGGEYFNYMYFHPDRDLLDKFNFMNIIDMRYTIYDYFLCSMRKRNSECSN